MLVLAVAGAPLTMPCARLYAEVCVCAGGTRTLVGVRSSGHLPGPTGLGGGGRATSASSPGDCLPLPRTWAGPSVGWAGYFSFSKFSNFIVPPGGGQG